MSSKSTELGGLCAHCSHSGSSQKCVSCSGEEILGWGNIPNLVGPHSQPLQVALSPRCSKFEQVLKWFLVLSTGRRVWGAVALCRDFIAYSTKESSNQENGGFLAHKDIVSKTEVSLCCIFPTQNCCQELSSDLLRFAERRGE